MISKKLHFLFSSTHFKPAWLPHLLLKKFSRYWGINLILHLSKAFHHYLSISPNIIQNYRGWKDSKYNEIILKFYFPPFTSVRVSVNIWWTVKQIVEALFRNFSISQYHFEFYWKRAERFVPHTAGSLIKYLIYKICIYNWIPKFFFHFYHRSLMLITSKIGRELF